MNDAALVAALFTPLFAGLVFHGLCIRFGWRSGPEVRTRVGDALLRVGVGKLKRFVPLASGNAGLR